MDKKRMPTGNFTCKKYGCLLIKQNLLEKTTNRIAIVRNMPAK